MHRIATTRLATGPAGRPTVVKSGPADAAAELEREADRLNAARHPGVVELLERRRAPDGRVELVLAYAGPRTLADVLADGVEPDRASDLLGQVAATLADVHGRGTVHGRLVPEHVVVGADDRAVLCGWGPGPERPVDDGDRPGGDEGEDAGTGSAADDVAALGQLLLAAADAAPDPASAWHLRALGQRAAAPDPATRPSPGRLAADLAGGPTTLLDGLDDGPEAADGEAVPRRAGVLPGRRRPGRPGPGRRSIALAAVVVVLLGGAVFILAGGGGSPPPPLVVLDPPAAEPDADAPGAPDTAGEPARAGSAAPAVDPGAATGDLGAEQLWPPPPPPSPCPAPAGRVADVDGDGCPDALTVIDGAVEAAGGRYEVGGAGDVVLVGDWDCDGLATAGALRPATGEVFLFPDWRDATVGPAQVVAAAVTATAVADGAGCDAVDVIDLEGATTRVRG